MRRKLVALATAGLLAVGALAAATQAASAAPVAPAAPVQDPGYIPPPVVFHSCSSPRLVAARAQCGEVTVPLDYANPAGQKIQIAISRVPHKSPDGQYQGLMLVNPGGPGGSGLGLSTLQSRVPNGGGDDYDWIGFDPRGVGSSRPALSCQKDYEGYNRPYYVVPPQSAPNEGEWLRKAARYTAACGVNGRDLLPHLSTVDSAKDMDSIRKALGQPKINYYGFSYGTYLGSVYSTLFPQNVRRAVFDGVVDPSQNKIWENANYDQDVAFEKNIKVFFDWVARYDNVYHLGTTEAVVEKKYYDQYQALRAAPAGGLIGSSEWNDIFLQAGYYVYGWEDIGSAFSKWVNNKDASGLLALYPPPTDDNGYAMYLGVQCIDAPWSKYDGANGFRAKNVALYPKAPFETWANAWFNAPCTFWPAKAGTPTKVNGANIPPILLVNETNDAATPFPGAQEMRKLFPNSVLVEGVPNGTVSQATTHAGTLQGQAPCEDQIVSKYLQTGALPARTGSTRSDTTCPATPEPVPTGVTAAPSPLAAAAAAEPVPQRLAG